MNDSDRIVRRVPAGQSLEVPCYASKFAVESASFPFALKFGDGNTNTAKAGLRYNFGEQVYRRFTLTNPSATKELIVTMWAGLAMVDFLFPSVPSTALVADTALFTGTGVGVVGGLYVVTNAAHGVTFPGIATTAAKYANEGVPEGARRKQFVVTNRSGLEEIYVTNQNNVVLAIVQTSADYTLESDATVKLFGTNGKGWVMTETFYT